MIARCQPAPTDGLLIAGTPSARTPSYGPHDRASAPRGRSLGVSNRRAKAPGTRIALGGGRGTDRRGIVGASLVPRGWSRAPGPRRHSTGGRADDGLEGAIGRDGDGPP